MRNDGRTHLAGRWRWFALMAALGVVALAAIAQRDALAQPQTPESGGAVTAPAADGAPSDTPAPLERPELEQRTGLFFVDLFWTSPYIIGITLGLSVLAVALFIYFMTTVTTAAMAPPDFVNNVTRLVIDRQYKEAADYCRANRGIFIASIVQRCVENAGKEHSVILDMLDAEGARRADVVWNRTSYLADVANVAPMLGLLGTVYGMILAFFGMPSEQMSINSKLLSTAIGGAMATTLFGLVVAIIALIFYSIVKARVTRVLADAESAVHSIADHIKRDADAPRAAGKGGRAAFIPRDEGDL